VTALVFVGIAFWMKERMHRQLSERQEIELRTLQQQYATDFQAFAEQVLDGVEAINKSQRDSAVQRNREPFLSGTEGIDLDVEKVDALASAILAKLDTPTLAASEPLNDYDQVASKITERISPILDEISETGELTRSDIQAYTDQISKQIAVVLSGEIEAKQQLNNNLLATNNVARDSLRLSQEMSALYISSLKDEGLLSRLLSLPVKVVQDISTLSIVGSSERKEIEERLFSNLKELEEKLNQIESNTPATEVLETSEKIISSPSEDVEE
jgi:polyhydroxyalkanoate synthesis regulator phasin